MPPAMPRYLRHSTPCHRRCLSLLFGELRTPNGWRKFSPEGCQGKIEGIEGPPCLDKPEGCQGKIEGIEGPLCSDKLEEDAETPPVDSQSLSSQHCEQLEQQEDKKSCLLPLPDQSHACVYNAGSGPIQVTIVTMGGKELSINGCAASTKIGDIKSMLQEMLSATSEELILLHGGDILDMVTGGGVQTIHDLGLDVPGHSLSIIRRYSQESLNQMLAKALQSGTDEEARELIDRGAGFDSEGNPALFMGSTMLHLALRNRLEDLALFLIKSGADVHTENECGRRPLAVAAMKGLGRIVVALVEAGANPDHRDRFDYTARYYGASWLALDQAKKNGSFDLLEKFCQGG